jgi:hypothetical protein
VWKHAPTWLAFSLNELLTAFALVCLVGSAAALFPFTWHLLIRSEQVDAVRAAIVIEQARLQQPQPNASDNSK